METGRMEAASGVADELEFLESSMDELRRTHAGHFLVIRGRRVLGAYGSEEEAYRAGVRQCGTKPFLLAQIGAQEVQASVPVLEEVWPHRDEGFIPHSWRRGKLIDNPIIELDIPPPTEADFR
jgi:hypothetical protein